MTKNGLKEWFQFLFDGLGSDDYKGHIKGHIKGQYVISQGQMA